MSPGSRAPDPWPASRHRGRRSSGRTAAGTARSRSSVPRSAARSRTGGSRWVRTRSRSELAPGETRDVVFLLGYAESPPDVKFEPGTVRLDTSRIAPVIAPQPGARGAGSRPGLAVRAELGTSASRSSGSRPVTGTSIAWSIPGTSTSAWSPSTSRGPRRCSSPGSGAGWGSGTRTRTCWGSSTSSPSGRAPGSSTSPRPSCPTAARITSTSPSRSAATTPSGPGSTTTPPGSSSPWPPTSRRPATREILDEPVPFDNAPGSEAPLYEHLRRSIGYTLDRLGRTGAAHRPRRLERLPQPQHVLGHARRVVPDTSSRSGGVAESVFIAGLFVIAARSWRRSRRAAATRRKPIVPDGGRNDDRCGRRPWLGRSLVPARLRLLRPADRLRGQRRGPDLPRAPGDLHHRASGSTTAGRPPRSRRSASGSPRRTGSCCSSPPSRATGSSSARSPRTRPDTRRTRACSATRTPG